MNKSLIKLVIVLCIIAFLFLYARKHNLSLKFEESYSGILINKYYKRGNAIDVRLANGEIYTVKVSIHDSIFNKIQIGDSLGKEKDEMHLKIIRAGNK